MTHETESPYHRTWYPVALAAELVDGTIVGQDFCGTRVVAYRDASGNAVVQGAWCPHLGADLSVGQVVEGRIRCAYHHWSFDGAGKCVHIPAGDAIPREARISTYPTAETWGIVWAFNGETPSFAPPAIPGATEGDVLARAVRGTVRQIQPFVAVSNGVDFQHLRTLHGLNAQTPPLMETGPDGLEYRIEMLPFLIHHGRITGTACFSQHLRTPMTSDAFMLFAGRPMSPDRSQFFNVVGVPRGEGEAARLDATVAFVNKLLSEDAPVLDTIRFKKGALIPSDRHLARFLHFVDTFPKAAPLD
jgi:phenylpropionate dioxygenase-like ring-hydroxylating dioxygenase large terminal subunit